MEKTAIRLFGRDFVLFQNVTLFPGTSFEREENAAEEKLDTFIFYLIEHENYCTPDREGHRADKIDELYGYVLPQEVADSDDEEEIRESLEDIFTSDFTEAEYEQLCYERRCL